MGSNNLQQKKEENLLKLFVQTMFPKNVCGGMGTVYTFSLTLFLQEKIKRIC